MEMVRADDETKQLLEDFDRNKILKRYLAGEELTIIDRIELGIGIRGTTKVIEGEFRIIEPVPLEPQSPAQD